MNKKESLQEIEKGLLAQKEKNASSHINDPNIK
jgi:hypothetical protein